MNCHSGEITNAQRLDVLEREATAKACGAFAVRKNGISGKQLMSRVWR